MEVGEYCRTKQGYIAKIEDIEEDVIFFDNVIACNYEETWVLFEDKFEEITKHSKNIVDLIEVGDIITLGINCGTLEVESIWNNGDELNIELSNNAIFEDIEKNENFSLYTILTHEQYEENCYKVVE